MVHFWNFKNHKIPQLWNTWRCVGFRLGFLGPSIHNLSRFIYFSMTILQISFSRRFSLYLTSSSDADDPFIIGFFLSFWFGCFTIASDDSSSKLLFDANDLCIIGGFFFFFLLLLLHYRFPMIPEWVESSRFLMIVVLFRLLYEIVWIKRN